jgi:hypothetical protein
MPEAAFLAFKNVFFEVEAGAMKRIIAGNRVS